MKKGFSKVIAYLMVFMMIFTMVPAMPAYAVTESANEPVVASETEPSSESEASVTETENDLELPEDDKFEGSGLEEVIEDEPDQTDMTEVQEQPDPETEEPDKKNSEEEPSAEPEEEQEPVIENGSFYHINPVYSDVISKADLEAGSGYAVSTFSEPEYVADESVIIEQIRQAMTERVETFNLYYTLESEFDKNVFGEWIEAAFAETAKANQGDYLRFHYGGSGISYGVTTYSTGRRDVDMTFNITYYTSAEQEEAVDEEVASILNDLGLPGSLSDYEKTKKIYDYICQNVSYDNENLENDEYKLKFTAYAALTSGKAVCQGYANLLYRLLREAGVNVRIISGIGNGGPHGWNIVEIDGKYYCADATWDSSRVEAGLDYEFFLRGSETFEDHVSDSKYTTSEFTGAYPVSTADYVVKEVLASGECGDNLTWELTTDGTLTISGTGDMYDYGESPWFRYSAKMNKLVLEEGITRIGDYAFSCCETLTGDLIIPDTVITIGECAFDECYGFDGKLELPENLETIGEFAFFDCQNLTGNLEIPESVTTIDTMAFTNCQKLTGNLIIPDGVKTIGKNAFETCYGFTGNLVIPDSVTSIGQMAFHKCNNLDGTLTLSKNLEKIEYGTFQYCSKLTGELVIPENVKTIGVGAFLDCNFSGTVVAHEGITSIDEYAFYQCDALEKLYVLNEECEFVGSICPGELTIYGYAGSTAQTYAENKSLTFVAIDTDTCDHPEGFDEILEAVDPTCTETGLTEGVECSVCGGILTAQEVIPKAGHAYDEWKVTKPATATETGRKYRTCVTCGETETQDIPCDESVTAAGECGDGVFWTFSEDGTLTIFGSGTINSSTATIWPEGVKKVIIQDGVTAIGTYAFYGVTTMESIEIAGSVSSIGQHAFMNCEALTSVELPEGLTEMGPAVFYGCSELRSVVLPTTLTAIPKDTFQSCKALESIVIPEGVESIGDNAFYFCFGVKSIELPSTLKTIGKYAFNGCTGLESITIPEGVKYITMNAFSGCSSLASVKLPNSLVSIDYYAFYQCTSLTDIEIGKDVSIFSGNAFTDVPLLHFADEENAGNYGAVAYHVAPLSCCIDCGKSHDKVIVPGVDVTCTEDGLTEGWSCTVCGTVVEQEAIEASGHTWSDWVVTKPATATETGSQYRTCATCGETETREIPVDETLKCGENATWMIDADGSLIISGTGAVTDNSGFKDLEINKVIIEEGITAIGDEIFKSSSMQSLEPLPSTLETIGDYAFGGCNLGTELILPENLTAIGKYAFTNTICSAAEIPANLGIISEGAFYGSMISYLTIQEGVTVIEDKAFSWTSLLGDIILPESIIAIGAEAFSNISGVEHYVILNPSCDITPAGMTPIRGFVGYGQSKSEEYAMELPGKPFVYLCDYYEKNHEYGEGTVIQEADCINQGITEFVCKNCNMLDYEYTSMDEEKHSFCEWTETEEPTCTKAGTESRTCTLCGVVESKEIAKIDHSEAIIPAVAATCKNTGLTEGKQCSSCLVILTAQEETPMADHSYGDWKTDINPTCTNAGSDYRICDVCGATDSRTVDALGHDYKAQVVKVTCLEDGYTKHICTDCNDEYTDSIVEAVGYHQVKEWSFNTIPTATREGEREGICTACEETITEALPLDPSVVDAGDCSYNSDSKVIWVLGTDGKLTLFGEGEPQTSGWTSYVDQIKTVVIEEGVTAVSSYAFQNCTNLTFVSIPESVTVIRQGAFYGCSGLTGTLIIPDSVTDIESYAFRGCSGLTGELDLSENLTQIGSQAFVGCSGLTGTLHIPGSVESVGYSAFSNCTGITGVELQYGIETILHGAFFGCENLSGVIVVPDSVTYLECFVDRIYTERYHIDKIYIPDSVTSIEKGLPQASSYYIYEGSYVDQYLKNSTSYYDVDIHYIPVSETVNKQTEFMDFRSATIVAGVDEYINLMDYIVSDRELTAADLEVTFSTEDYTSYDNGQIYTWDPGECTVTVKAGEHVSSAVLKIIDESYEKTEATAIAFNQQEITLEKGEKFYNKPVVLPLNTTNTVVAWSSSDSEIATVSQNGTVTGISVGTVEITAKISDTVSESYTVNVDSPLLNIYVVDAFENYELIKGESESIIFQTYPADARRHVKFVSSNEDIVTVDENGKMTAVNAGDATVTLVGNGKNAVVKVTVGNPLKGISIKEYAQRIAVGDTVQLEMKLTPEDAVLEVVPVWTSSNTAVATVDENGAVTAVKTGTADITVTVGDFTATTAVYCRNTAMTGVNLEKESMEIPYGHTATLKAAKLPENTSDTTAFAWTSDNEEVATANENGEITAVGLGTAKITVIAGDFMDTCEITVTKAEPEYEVPSDLSLAVGLTVGSLELPEGFTWNNPDASRTSRGTAVFYVTYTPDDTAHYTVVRDVAIKVQIVEPKVLSVDLIDALAVCIGTEYQMESVLDVEVQDGGGYDLIWETGDEEVATVDATGKLVAVAPGETAITLRIQDDFEETCKLVVNDHRWRASYTIDKKPTCTETGSESIHCADCNVIKPDSARDIAALEHSYTEWIVAVEPTTESDGERYKECVSCDGVIKEVLPACIAYGKLNENQKWIIYPDGTLEISGTGKLEKSAVLHEYSSQITGLVIGDGITEIGDYAFQDFGGVKNNLVIPNSVTAIGDSAFAVTVPGTVERTLTLSENLKTIGNHAFAGNSNLTGDLVIPDSVTTIESYAFRGCTGFKGSLKLSESLETIKENTFRELKFTGAIVIPDSVKNIEAKAFYNCSGIESITLSENLEKIGASAFAYCDALRGDLVIPDSVTVIGNNAFDSMGTNDIGGTLKLSKNLTTIGDYAFQSQGFTGDLVIPDSVTTIGYSAFNRCGFNGKLTLSENLTTIGNSAFYDCEFEGDLIIPNSVISIGTLAFSGQVDFSFNSCGFNGELKLSENLKNIGSYAFQYCGFTGDLEIADSVTTIGDYAFANCKFNEKLILSENLKTIGSYAFQYCGFTGDLVIPDSVTTIGERAFNGTGFDGMLTLSQRLTEIEAGTFMDMDNITGDLVIPDSITTIGDCAFSSMSGSAFKGGNLKLSENLKTIGESAFNRCRFTGDLVIPDSVTTIGRLAFYMTGFDGTLTLSDGLTTLEDGTFLNCGFTGKLVIPDTVTTIGYNVFDSCGFTSVEIPASVKTIKKSALWFCENMTAVIIKAKDIEIDVDAFVRNSKQTRYYCVYKDSAAEALINAYKKSCDVVRYLNEDGNIEGGHVWSDATCNAPKKCAICGETKDEALGHDWRGTPCEQTCERCGGIRDDLSGHDWKNATCTTPKTCRVCGETQGKALGHKKKTLPAVESTCTTTGLTAGVACTVCDRILTAQKKVGMKDHSFGEWIVDKKATCNAEGSKHRGCTVCGTQETVKIAKTNKHSYSDKYTVDEPATQTKEGSKSRHCKVSGCEAKTSVTVIPMLKGIKLSATKYVYSGSARKPSVTVTNVNGGTISSSHYTVTYASGRTKVGRYKVTVTFKGDYDGVKTAYFTIVPKAPSSASAELSTTTTPASDRYDDIKFSWKASTGASGYLVYYKKASSSKWSSPVATTSLSYTKKELAGGVQYTFKVVPYYKSGTTKYYNTAQYKTASVYTLKKVSTPTVVKSGTKVKVSWSNINGETGYEISKSTSKTKIGTITPYKTTTGKSKLISATKGKTYYYRVRAYKTVGTKKVYGPWSNPKAYKRK